MSRSTFTSAEAVELAVVERSGFVESRHVGSAVVLGPDGAELISLGRPDVPVFTRSSLKPLQAIAAMSLGAEVSGASAALATASHKSEAGHVEVVSQMLDSVGLSASDLKCPAAHPADGKLRRQLQEEAWAAGAAVGIGAAVGNSAVGDTKSPLYFNCSGKHAAFLMAAVAQGAETANYLDPDHPVQTKIAEVVRTFSGEDPAAVGVDGCGAPVFALSLVGLARAIGRVVTLGTGEEATWTGEAAGESSAAGEPSVAGESSSAENASGNYTAATSAYAAEARTLMNGVFENPWGIEGHGRPNSTVIERLGVFAKGGAEGVIVMATTTGYSVALKCLDGSSRATGLVALELLDRAGAFANPTSTSANPPAPANPNKHATPDEPANPTLTSANISRTHVTPALLAEVSEAITDPITGGTDTEGRTALVGRLIVGKDVASIERMADGDSQKD